MTVEYIQSLHTPKFCLEVIKTSNYFLIRGLTNSNATLQFLTDGDERVEEYRAQSNGGQAKLFLKTGCAYSVFGLRLSEALKQQLCNQAAA